MMLWGVFGGMLLATLLIVLWPIWRGQGGAHRLMLIALIITVIPLGTAGLYYLLGSPGLPARPYVARLADPDIVMERKTQELAQILESTPNAEGYERLGDAYYLLNEYAKAAAAYQRAIDLQDPKRKGNPQWWSKYGEALVMANEGMVVPDARKAFSQALRIDKKEFRARFYLGLAETQIGDLRKAVAIWRDLERDSPVDAPWLAMVQANITGFSKEGGFDPASIPPAYPPLSQ